MRGAYRRAETEENRMGIFCAFLRQNGWGGGGAGLGERSSFVPLRVTSADKERERVRGKIRFAGAGLEVEAHAVFTRVDFAFGMNFSDGFGHFFGAVGVVGEALYYEVF